MKTMISGPKGQTERGAQALFLLLGFTPLVSNNLDEGRFMWLTRSIIKVIQGRSSRQDAGGSIQSRDHGGVLLTGLLSMGHRQPKTTCLGVAPPTGS